MFGYLQVVGGAYIIVGALHSIWLELSVSKATCAAPTEGLVWIHCNVGMGISYAVTTLVWPLYWI
jgi:hypothetical protein